MSTYYEELPLSQLVIHPKNVRKDVGVVVDLANSIAAKGLLQPLVVAPMPGNENRQFSAQRYIIIGGHRRHAAAQLAGLTRVDCVVRSDLDTEASQLEAMLVENTQRTDLTVTEEAEAYQALLEFPGYTIKTIAKGVGRSQKLVRERVALTKLPEDAKSKLADHTLTIERALVLSDFADDAAATERLMRQATAHQSNWDYYLRQEQERREWIAGIPALRAELEAAGIAVIDRPEGNSWEWKEWRMVTATGIGDIQDHVGKGRSAILEGPQNGITWVVPREQTSATQAAPEPTEEERAEAEKVGRMTAGLGLATHVRAEFLQAVVKRPPSADRIREAVLRMVLDSDNLYQDFAGLLQLGEDLDECAVGEEVQKLSTDQLVMLLFIAGREKERHMTALTSWNPMVVGWSGTNEWRDDLIEVLGYKFNDIENEVIDYHRAKNGAAFAEELAEAS